MKVWVFGPGDSIFTSRELAEAYKEVSATLGEDEDWYDEVREVEVLDSLPKVTRKFVAYSSDFVDDRYVVEGQPTYHNPATVFDTYEEAVEAARKMKEEWVAKKSESDAKMVAESRRHADERYEKLKAAGVVA